MEHVSAEPMSDWFFFSFLILFFLTAISCLAFAQFTVRRIEKQIKEDNISHQEALDFGGSRILTYAYVILSSERFALRLKNIIDASVIKSYANNYDWWRSLFFVIAIHLWIFTGLLGFFFDSI